MKSKILLPLLALLTVLFVGCTGQKASPSPTTAKTTPNTTTNAAQKTTDVVTTASIVDNAADFEKAIGKDGEWIICLIKDITINKDITLDGEFKNNRGETQRKIALYEQDNNRNITARYTLTAPKLTINSPEASIQHGTFKGDLYVSAKNFQLVDTTVEGNVYFTNEEAQSTFKMDENSKITGKQELKK